VTKGARGLGGSGGGEGSMELEEFYVLAQHVGGGLRP
jgi:hypothetical protein